MVSTFVNIKGNCNIISTNNSEKYKEKVINVRTSSIIFRT